MQNFISFLAEIGIENENLTRGFEDVEIYKTVYNKFDGKCFIYIKSKNILLNDRLERIKNEITKKMCPPLNSVRLIVKVDGIKKKSIQSTLKKYWNNIFYLIKRETPSILAFGDTLEHLFVENTLKIKVPNEFIYQRFEQKEIAKKIQHMILEELGIEINIKIEVAKKNLNVSDDIEKIIQRQEHETNKIISQIQFGKPETSDTEEKYTVSYEIDPDIIYGERMSGYVKEMKDIDEKSRTICVVGSVFETNIKELRNGKTIYSIYLTDNTGAICCKVYLNDMNKEKVTSQTKVGSYLRIMGDIIKNHYTDEIELTITTIKKEKKEERKDNSKEKRVELHAHTQMSAMDSIVSVKSLINKAQSWGHKAIAITDHGVVQAFPDAMNASKGSDIKVIYGVEAYLVDDDKDIIQNANNLDFDQKFVVFDIETTGFSPTNDNITEIGAVLIENGSIKDQFSSFVNPKMDIPYKVQEITGITNEMVEDAPPIEEVLSDFMNFSKEAVFVAHNADFDTGFISQKCKEIGIDYNHEKIDTLMLARILLTDLKKFSLDKVSKELGISLKGHHRAVNDAAATAEIFIKFIDIFKKAGLEKLSEVNQKYGKIDFTKIRPTHATIYALNNVGLKNLYRIISDSHINHFYKSPRILKSFLSENRDGLFIGTACSSGELFNAVQRNKSEKEIEEIMKFYDFIEIMPVENNLYLVSNGEVKDEEELRDINRKLVEYGEKFGKLVVATGDVHMLEPYESIFRDVLRYSQGFSHKNSVEKLYFRTTDEMLEEFSYLGEEKAYEVVITNSNLIADKFENIKPIPSETYPPIIEGSDEKLREMCFEKAYSIYGNPLPEIVEARLDRELNSIIGNGYAVMYIIANKLVAKSMSDGYLVGSRGSVGSSFAATMSDITEVNPLPAHYVCPNCKYSHFFGVGEWGSGIDLPNKKCPECGTDLIKDGHDIPFEVFLGFEGDKEPDIDLNFSGVYQPTIHKYTEDLFGEGYTYRAGTIGTVKDKTAFGYVKKYSDENYLDFTMAEKNRLMHGCTGVKKTSGQHPGGVMVIPDYKDVHDFTPIQYPANDKTSGVITTHFDYHSISGRILKLDILGHDGPTIIRMLEDMTGIKITDIPLDDPETMSLFTSTKALGVTEEEIGSPVGSLAIPEFGTKFTRQMLVDTKPTTFAELVRIAGLSHGTDVWLNNAQDLVRGNVVGLKDVISTRDDIMNYLIFSGLKPKMAFTIMESVRKGKGLKPEFEEAMKENEVPSWYIDSCKKIKYMFPKAHAVAYVMTSFRIAYCKVNYPEAFYATYFTTKVEDFDIELIKKGIDVVKKKIEEIRELGNQATTKENSQLTILEVVVEMYARGIEFMNVDLYKSDASEFKILDKGKILPPMVSLQGMGENAAINIIEERKNGEFLSKEDLISRTKISKTVVEKLSEHGSLDGMSEKNQISFF
ncbi:PolC-type DNA polymerase III [Peptostreptococcus faecalis]|uniref:PolC-type DNA polymerase III n=1 Tax=Peptostreptococcus faecalis TaxID=2045015 RepID=UPI000C7BFC54|nr:PolC-type DNA polymerase III [Peptostreptococcus faecalis]